MCTQALSELSAPPLLLLQVVAVWSSGQTVISSLESSSASIMATSLRRTSSLHTALHLLQASSWCCFIWLALSL